MNTLQPTSQNKKGGKNDLTNQAILPQLPGDIHVWLTGVPNWQGCS